jgi:dynein heavy chain, axonemal
MHALTRASSHAAQYGMEAEAALLAFKAAKLHIDTKCRVFHETLLVSMEKKRLYDHLEYAQQQAQHQAQVSRVERVADGQMTNI